MRKTKTKVKCDVCGLFTSIRSIRRTKDFAFVCYRCSRRMPQNKLQDAVATHLGCYHTDNFKNKRFKWRKKK